MNLISVFNQFPNQQACIDHLEAIRWPEVAFCPLCNSDRVARKQEGQKVGRWNCHNCTSSFNVLSGTIFQGTRVPLQKWFLAISLMANAKRACRASSWPAIWNSTRKRRGTCNSASGPLWRAQTANCCRVSLRPTKRT